MKKYMNKLSILLLVCLSTAKIYTNVEEEKSSNDDIREAFDILRQDFANLGTAIKTNSAAQLNKMKDWVKTQEDKFKESLTQLQTSINQTNAKMQAKIDAIATAPETKDEAKASALLQQLQDEMDENLQSLKEDTKAANEKFKSDLQYVKTQWNKYLEDLQIMRENNLKAFNESMDKTKSYLRGFKGLIQRKMVQPFASSTT